MKWIFVVLLCLVQFAEGSNPMNEGYITTGDGVRLFYRKIGTSPSIVVIPNGFYLLDDFQSLSEAHSLLVYDVRNRGRSDTVTDTAKLSRGIHQDVDDLETVRRHFNIDRMKLIGHSYIGMMAGVYAMKYHDRVERVVQIGPSQPFAEKQYPPELTFADDTLRTVFAKIGELQKQSRPEDPVQACEQFWSVLRLIYVTNPGDAEKIRWGRCDLTNERNFMKYWNEHIFPSIKSFKPTAMEFEKAQAAVLTIHGRKDRSAPYGGGREWASLFLNARLVTVENGGHAPWIESPDLVFGAIQTFLAGQWPEHAERISQ